MTIDEIKENADLAETWPGSGVLNWGEVGFNTLAAWVAEFNWRIQPGGDGIRTDTFDLESVKGRPYDRRGAGLSGLGQWLRIPGRLRDDALFCSELADVAHCAGGLVYGKDRTPTPEELIRRPIYGSVHRIKGAL
jgi:hypothetical protein